MYKTSALQKYLLVIRNMVDLKKVSATTFAQLWMKFFASGQLLTPYQA